MIDMFLLHVPKSFYYVLYDWDHKFRMVKRVFCKSFEINIYVGAETGMRKINSLINAFLVM